jgi:hypothetical protein
MKPAIAAVSLVNRTDAKARWTSCTVMNTQHLVFRARKLAQDDIAKYCDLYITLYKNFMRATSLT